MYSGWGVAARLRRAGGGVRVGPAAATPTAATAAEPTLKAQLPPVVAAGVRRYRPGGGGGVAKTKAPRIKIAEVEGWRRLWPQSIGAKFGSSI